MIESKKTEKERERERGRERVKLSINIIRPGKEEERGKEDINTNKLQRENDKE
jgi:hypothetical protein